ncbi:PH domain-containing protein [Candidatus Saccharibacteria bacterium]|nr:PH domain-containing protein [Candidatus Saccharibacteria bacterium]MCB9817457.1 PH domain-containing protein [Candidatus Nomurabacteria bacterium]HPD99322.1 PH domain-containing protein [Candidatus Saccharibacteria bacterium]
MQNTDHIKTYKQSKGYLHSQLLGLHVTFIAVYIAIIALSIEGDTVFNIAGLIVGEFDISIILVGFIVQMLFSFVVMNHWSNTMFKITDNAVAITTGIISQHTQTISLDDIVAPQVHQSPLGTYYSYGTITFNVRFSDEPIQLRGVSMPNTFIEDMRIQMRNSAPYYNMEQSLPLAYIRTHQQTIH